MIESYTAGHTPLERTLAAAAVLVDLLRLADGDQAAVLGFDSEAYLFRELTSDRDALHVTLSRLPTGRQSRLDLGIEYATVELSGSRHRAGNAPVMVVLTDGPAEPVGPAVAEQRAVEAKRLGITIFTIGMKFGLRDDPRTNLDREALQRMASTPDHYYETNDSRALADIYRCVAAALPCPSTVFWGHRP